MNYPNTILLVDDNEDDIFLLRSAFTKAEFNCPLQEAHNGMEAMAYLSGEGAFKDRARFPLPKVMLLDLNMPMKSGFDVLSWLRTQEGLKRLTVIVLTASTRQADVERAFDLGANAFLVKPSTVQGLTAQIRSLRDWLQHNHFPSLNNSAMRPS